jgi:hypothetical protein
VFQEHTAGARSTPARSGHIWSISCCAHGCGMPTELSLGQDSGVRSPPSRGPEQLYFSGVSVGHRIRLGTTFRNFPAERRLRLGAISAPKPQRFQVLRCFKTCAPCRRRGARVLQDLRGLRSMGFGLENGSQSEVSLVEPPEKSQTNSPNVFGEPPSV